MFGKNQVAKRRTEAEGMLLNSLFYTIQGEGPAAGIPSIFVRFSGCNLRCHFCDTEFESGESISVPALTQRIASMIPPFQNYRIVFTGGEPMLQPLPKLIKALAARGITGKIDIETAGTVWPEDFLAVNPYVRIICSPKTPVVHREIHNMAYAWKYIIKAGETSPIDGLPNRNTQAGLDIIEQNIFRPDSAHFFYENIYVQPCDEGDPVKNALNADECARVAMKYGYRLCLQLHKIVGLP